MKKVVITILCILVIGGIGFGGYKLVKNREIEEEPSEIVVVNPL